MNNELMLDVGQANELKLAFRREGDWNNEKIKALTERRGLLTQVLDVLEGRSQIVVINPEIITVDYSMSLENMIGVGRYDWTNSDITAKRFPIIGEGKIDFEVKIFHFDRSISSEDAVAQIIASDSENPWEPAKIENLLAYGAKNPEEQRKFRIVGLGSVGKVGGDRRVPFLSRDSCSGRDLDLLYWHGVWGGNYRFLAVRKIKPSGN